MSIFSTYSQGENRITATFLAVLQELSLSRIDHLLGEMLEDDNFNSITFANQPSSGGTGVPDAEISSSMRILLETKIVRNRVEKDQLTQHLARFDGANSMRTQMLIVLTPDSTKPKVIEDCKDSRIVWTNFQGLDTSINALFDDPRAVISEREQFLLREFQELMSDSQLLSPDKDTIIVPAKNAWSIYKRASVYACQVNRSFQAAKYMGFYSEKMIQPAIAKILEIHDNVVLKPNLHEGKLGESVNSLLQADKVLTGMSQKIFILSPIDSEETLSLPNSIKNDTTSHSGKNVAFTQNQRYVESKQLFKARVTSQIGTVKNT